MNNHERDGSGKTKPVASDNGPAGLQIYPESPQQQKEWEREILESMLIPEEGKATEVAGLGDLFEWQIS